MTSELPNGHSQPAFDLTAIVKQGFIAAAQKALASYQYMAGAATFPYFSSIGMAHQFRDNLEAALREVFASIADVSFPRIGNAFVMDVVCANGRKYRFVLRKASTPTTRVKLPKWAKPGQSNVNVEHWVNQPLPGLLDGLETRTALILLYLPDKTYTELEFVINEQTDSAVIPQATISLTPSVLQFPTVDTEIPRIELDFASDTDESGIDTDDIDDSGTDDKHDDDDNAEDIGKGTG